MTLFFQKHQGSINVSCSHREISTKQFQILIFLSFTFLRIWSFSNQLQVNNHHRSVSVGTILFANDFRNAVEEHSGENVQTLGLNSEKDKSIKLYTNNKKSRRPSRRQRKPRNYWRNIENLRKEIYDFWIKDAKVSLSPDDPLPIPSETLINLFERYDLRNGINVHGGRESVADSLGDAILVPGKWSEAAKTCSIVQQLLDQSDGDIMSNDIPPISPQIQQFLDEKKKKSDLVDENEHERFYGGNRWTHKKGRKPKGYWTEELVISQLWEYLETVKIRSGRPSVYMPRPSEISAADRDDLKQAINRFGGTKYICKKAGLIPYNEWKYFETQLELYIELDSYLQKYHNNSQTDFPRVGEVLSNGNSRLYDLILSFGGGKLVACKLDMRYASETGVTLFQGSTFGRFSLDFAIKLMKYIRLQVIELSPPLQQRHLYMPSTADLVKAKEKELAIRVMAYGGVENVARRLGLVFKTVATRDKNE